MTADVPASATGVITVDLDRIAANWRALADLVSPAACAAVVKADAYGLGAAPVMHALLSAGCRTFFVATAVEALAARMGSPDAILYVLDGLLPESADALLSSGAVPVLSTLDEVREWSAAASSPDKRASIALHIDTGLNRLGMPEADIDALAADAALLARLDIRLVMSHLASADDPDDPKSEAQRHVFERLRARLPAAPASLAASDGLMLGPAYHFDLVRPGYAIYGGQAFKGGATPVRSAVSVAVRVLQVRNVAPGQTVGYSGSWRAERPSRIAIIAAGYADGLPRGLSAATGTAGLRVGIGGETAPIVGRVSMDLITIDVTDLTGDIRRGDLVTLIGDNASSIETLGAAAGTIGYEILTRLGTRFHRCYRERAG